MSTKITCDGCGNEIVARGPLRAEAPKLQEGSLIIETHYASAYDLCKNCIIDAFKKLDDRPKKIEGPYVEIVFDGPPGPEAGRFVEVENPKGQSVNLGTWWHRPDGLWALRVSCKDGVFDRPSLPDSARGAKMIDPHAAQYVVNPQTGEWIKYKGRELPPNEPFEMPAGTKRLDMMWVPIEPTEAMRKAATNALMANAALHINDVYHIVWEAMLDAVKKA